MGEEREGPYMPAAGAITADNLVHLQGTDKQMMRYAVKVRQDAMSAEEKRRAEKAAERRRQRKQRNR